MANGHGGRRPGAGRKPKAITTLRKLALENAGSDAERALAFVVSVMDNSKQPVRMRYAAAVEIMDRVWGRSTQRQEVTGDSTAPIVVRVIGGMDLDAI